MKSSSILWIAGTAVVGLIVAGWAISAHQGYKHRARLTEAINELGRARDAEQYEMVARKPGGPAKREVKSQSPMVARLVVDYEARSISAFIDHERLGHHEVPGGRSITYTAVMDGSKLVEWRCTSDLPARLLPAACR